MGNTGLAWITALGIEVIASRDHLFVLSAQNSPRVHSVSTKLFTGTAHSLKLSPNKRRMLQLSAFTNDNL